MTADYLRAFWSAPEVAPARVALATSRNVEGVLKNGSLLQSITQRKTDAVSANDEALAKALWCLEQIAKVQNHYLAAYQEMREELFYDAWCNLDRAEIELHFLDRHFQETSNEFRLEFIRAHATRFQELYPYHAFYSPAVLKEEIICSICQNPISLRNPCAHRVGEIYQGEMAGTIVTKCRLLEVSLVTEPKQRYSVAFVKGRDYDYSLVNFVVQRLTSPWSGWSYEWTTRLQPHSLYNASRNDPCPCESGKKYKRCCLGQAGIRRPHCQILFEEAPPPGLDSYEWHPTISPASTSSTPLATRS